MPLEIPNSEIRTIDFRTARITAGESRRIRGTAIVFNSLSEKLGNELGGYFREIIEPTAVDRSLRNGADFYAFFNHDTGRILGRTKSGTLRANKSSQGLEVVIDPPDTNDARDVVALIERGDVDGMSFRFTAMGEDETWWSKYEGIPLRKVKDMLIHEVSVVTYPAYPDTSVAMRSLGAFQETLMNPEILRLRAKLDAPLPWEIDMRMLKQVGKEWCVYTKDGSKQLGCHPTKAAAMMQLQAIEAHK